MVKKYLPIVMALTLLGVGGCASSSNTAAKCHPVISKDACRETVKMNAGEKTMIILAENPTTGYQWNLTNSAPQFCRVVSSKYIAPTKGLMGAPGRREVIVEAVSPGKSVLEFSYARSWEKKQPPAENFKTTIEINE